MKILFSRGFLAPLIVGLLLVGLGARPRFGFQAPAGDAIDSYVRSQLAAQHIPGLALAVVRDGQLVKSQGYGLANIELNVAVTPETVFQLGSIGKQFTATEILLLAEDGKLSLDDSITKYFSGAPPAWREITVRRLLNHTSGLDDYTDDKYIGRGGLTDLHAELSDDEIFHRFSKLPFVFKPGTKWQYCNTGYAILGFLVRKASGKSYGDFLGARVFKPLGMNATRVIDESSIIPNRAAGYLFAKGEIENQSWVSPHWNTLADGALYSTAADMAKWDAG